MYERTTRLACSILVCNYAGLNMAIDLGLDKEKSADQKMEIASKPKQ
jgi:hypothetical protein